MKKKITVTILTLVCALCCAFGFTACDEKKETGLTYEKVDGGYSVKQYYYADGKTGSDGRAPLNLVIPSEYKGEPVIAISNSAFEGRKELVSVEIPNSVTNINYGAFAAAGLLSVKFGTGLKTVGISAFNACKELTKIELPIGVISIKSKAFYSCSELITVVIPSTVTSIEDEAFAFCMKLQTINFGGTKEQWDSVTKGNNWNNMTGTCNIVYAD